MSKEKKLSKFFIPLRRLMLPRSRLEPQTSRLKSDGFYAEISEKHTIELGSDLGAVDDEIRLSGLQRFERPLQRRIFFIDWKEVGGRGTVSLASAKRTEPRWIK